LSLFRDDFSGKVDRKGPCSIARHIKQIPGIDMASRRKHCLKGLILATFAYVVGNVLRAARTPERRFSTGCGAPI
jgi:hypothetical protein